MGVDLRVGKGGNYARYRVYAPDVDIHDSIHMNDYFIGILHAQDITAYTKISDVYGNKYQRDNTTATIKTEDIIDIGNDYFLYSIAEDCWYRVESVAPNSHNESQRFSARPINTTTIVIVKG